MDGLTTAITTLSFLGAGLLVLAGVAKIPRPDGAMATLHRLRLPSGRVAARLLGLVEALAGLLIITLGGLVASLLLAALYVPFAGISAWQRSRQMSCGCFGTSDTAVTALHVALNVGFAAAGVVALVPRLSHPASLSDVAMDAGIVGAATAVLLLGVATVLVRTFLVRAAEQQVRRRPLLPATSTGERPAVRHPASASPGAGRQPL